MFGRNYQNRKHPMNSLALVSINTPGNNAIDKLLQILVKKELPFKITIFCKENTFENPLIEQYIVPYHKIEDVFQQHWDTIDIFLCFVATGIIIRKIAPYLKSKTTDPGILVMSMDLKQIVPLVSGHIGEANIFSEKISQLIPDCKTFITTATDQTDNLAFDLFAKQYEYKLLNIKKLAAISNAIINNKQVQIITYPEIFSKIENYKGFQNDKFKFINIQKDTQNINPHLHTVVISPSSTLPSVIRDCLVLIIPEISIGIGLNRNTPHEILKQSLFEFLWEHGLLIQNIKNICSFKEKSNEPGLLSLSEELNISLKFFDEDQINSIENNLSTSRASDYFNVKGVAEPSAILGSNEQVCFLNKHIYHNAVTLSAAF